MRAVMIAAAAVAVATACASRTSSAGPDKFRVDDINVVAAVLKELHQSPMSTFVVNETEVFLPAAWRDASSDVIQPVSPTTTVTISRDLIDKYTQRNRTSYPIPRSAVPDDVRVITPLESEELMRRSDGTPQQLNSRIVRVSMPAYAPSGTLALMSYSVTEGRLAGSAGFMLLRKGVDGWRIETIVPVVAA